MDYKIEQLEKMLEAEKHPQTGGYGAHLKHWHSTGKSIHLDAEAIRALIRHYEVRAGLRPARKAYTQRCDLEKTIATMGIYDSLAYMRGLGFDITEGVDENANNAYYESADGMEYAYWRHEEESK